MKRNKTCIILCIILALIRINNCYAQVQEIKKYKDTELEGSLFIEWFFDEKTENLTIQIKNGYKFRVEIVQRKYDLPFYLDVVYEDGKRCTYDRTGFGFSNISDVLKLKADSVYINTYKLDLKRLKIKKIVISERRRLPFTIIDEQGECVAFCMYHQKEKHFNYSY